MTLNFDLHTVEGVEEEADAGWSWLVDCSLMMLEHCIENKSDLCLLCHNDLYFVDLADTVVAGMCHRAGTGLARGMGSHFVLPRTDCMLL